MHLDPNNCVLMLNDLEAAAMSSAGAILPTGAVTSWR